MEFFIENERTLRAFQEVWARIPETHKRLIDRYAEIDDAALIITDSTVLCPFEVDEALYGAAWYDPDTDERFVYITPRAMKLDSDADLQYVIAHELAHIYFDHSYWRIRATEEGWDEGDFRAAGLDDWLEEGFDPEVDAIDMAAQWGFSRSTWLVKEIDDLLAAYQTSLN